MNEGIYRIIIVQVLAFNEISPKYDTYCTSGAGFRALVSVRALTDGKGSGVDTDAFCLKTKQCI